MSQPPFSGGDPAARDAPMPSWPQHNPDPGRTPGQQHDPQWPTAEQPDRPYQAEPVWPGETTSRTAAGPAGYQPGGPGGPSGPGGPAGGSQDRLWVHFIWEAMLVIGVVISAVLVMVAGNGTDALTRGFDHMIMSMASLGLIASGLALSLRVAAPNLAVGTIGTGAAGLIGLLVMDYDWAASAAIPVVLLIALVTGLLLALVVVGLHVPAWAASIGAAVVMVAIAVALDGQPQMAFNPEHGWVIGTTWPWFSLFIAVSVGGGVLWALPALRARLGGTRAEADPADRPGMAAGLGAAAGLIGSTLLAAIGGILYLLHFRFSVGVTSPVDRWTTFALAAVLLGGVSVYGRRGGVFGTVLAVILLSLLQRALALAGAGAWAGPALVGAAIVVGLAVSRGMEFAGRQRPPAVPRMPEGQPGGQPASR